MCRLAFLLESLGQNPGFLFPGELAVRWVEEAHGGCAWPLAVEVTDKSLNWAAPAPGLWARCHTQGSVCPCLLPGLSLPEPDPGCGLRSTDRPVPKECWALRVGCDLGNMRGSQASRSGQGIMATGTTRNLPWAELVRRRGAAPTPSCLTIFGCPRPDPQSFSATSLERDMILQLNPEPLPPNIKSTTQRPLPGPGCPLSTGF